MPDGLLRIGELSRRTGLSVDVIRAWERRYDLLTPARTAGNFRLYSPDDISRLRLMRHYQSAGLPTAQAAGLVHRVQNAALDSNPGIPPGDVRTAVSVIRAALESFDDAPAGRVLDRLLGVFAAGAVLRDVVLPYLHDVGERWASGQTSVAQEHFASTFIEAWMLTMARGWGRPTPRRAVLACLPGERHTIGLLAFGLALHDLGWRITYLGADTPVDAVRATAEAVRPQVVVLSCALPSTWAATADDVRRLDGDFRLALGGAGVADDHGEWLAGHALPPDPIIAARSLALDGVAAQPKVNT